jgi:hypothetical protein
MKGSRGTPFGVYTHDGSWSSTHSGSKPRPFSLLLLFLLLQFRIQSTHGLLLTPRNVITGIVGLYSTLQSLLPLSFWFLSCVHLLCYFSGKVREVLLGRNSLSLYFQHFIKFSYRKTGKILQGNWI